MNYMRYKLSAWLIKLAIAVIPEEYTRSRVRMGMLYSANLINTEMDQLEAETNAGEGTQS